LRRHRRGGCRHVGFDAHGDFKFKAEPPECGPADHGARAMRPARQHDPSDRMVDAAELLHRLRGQADLVADGVAMFGAKQPDIVGLDVIGIRDIGRALAAIERLEVGVGLVLGEQRLRRMSCRDIVHVSLPFSKA
jgi:hypothetical protein